MKTEKIVQWNERFNQIIIEPEPNMKLAEQKEPCKNWEMIRDFKKK